MRTWPSTLRIGLGQGGVTSSDGATTTSNYFKKVNSFIKILFIQGVPINMGIKRQIELEYIHVNGKILFCYSERLCDVL